MITTNPDTISTNKNIITTNPNTISTNPKIITTNPKTITTNPSTITANPKEITTNPKSITINSNIITINLKTISTTTLEPQISILNSTGYIPDKFESPFNIITLILFQAKLKDNQLYLYLSIDSNIPNSFSLKININIFTQNSLRNQEMEITVSLLNYTRSNSYGGIYTFVSNQTFKDYLKSQGKNTRIVVTKIASNIKNNKYEYNIKMGSNSDYLDTAKMEQMLQNNQTVDLSQIKNVNIYHLESISQGCSFELTTNETIKITDRELNLEFKEIKSQKNKSIKCSLKQYSNKIKCYLDEMIDNIYAFKDYIDFNNIEFFSIISNKEFNFPMYCYIKSPSSSSSSKGKLTLIIIISIVVIIIIVSLALFIYIKTKANKNNSKNEESPTIKNFVIDSDFDNLDNK